MVVHTVARSRSDIRVRSVELGVMKIVDLMAMKLMRYLSAVAGRWVLEPIALPDVEASPLLPASRLPSANTAPHPRPFSSFPSPLPPPSRQSQPQH